MKYVFSSNSEAIHIYANDPERRGRASSISFGGGVLFSYNTAIAQHVTDEQGETAIIVNNTSYSVSTSKHQSLLRYAANHLTRLYVSHIPYNTQDLKPKHAGDRLRLIEAYERQAADYLVKASRARSKADDYRAAAYHVLNELKDYFAFFGIEYEAGDLSALEAAAAEADSKAREAAKIRAAEKIKEQAEALEAWRKGEDKRHYFEVTALRINGDTIETTKGANIPLDHAVKAWPLLKRLHDSGGVYQNSGHSIHLGHYTVSRFERDTLTVGCHKIPFSEVSAIASQLGLQ